MLLCVGNIIKEMRANTTALLVRFCVCVCSNTEIFCASAFIEKMRQRDGRGQNLIARAVRQNKHISTTCCANMFPIVFDARQHCESEFMCVCVCAGGWVGSLSWWRGCTDDLHAHIHTRHPESRAKKVCLCKQRSRLQTQNRKNIAGVSLFLAHGTCEGSSTCC